MKDPFFIVFEGIDGSGKSTQIKNITQKLIDKKIPIYQTFEPTKHQIGKMIRDVFSGNNQADEHTIASLFLADRLEHILNPKDGLLLNLKKGNNILCDRYYLSSLAYHSVHVDMNWVFNCNKRCVELLKPTATIFIDIDPKISLDRINSRNETIELYETIENLEKVRNNYYKSFDLLKSDEKIIFIDGNKTQNEVTQNIWNQIQEFI